MISQRLLVLLLLVPHVMPLSDLKCVVCKQIVKEINSAIEQENPHKTIQVGSFRIQPDGSQKQSQIKYAGSEIHLNEILETICSLLENYAQVKHKESGELALFNLEKDIDKLSTYDFVPDTNLNRDLKYYCESFVEDHEDEIISFFTKSSIRLNSNPDAVLCQSAAGYCPPDHNEL